MTRNGKIARLPCAIREEVNVRLRNGGKAQPICEWLNGLPQVKAMLTAEFNGHAIRKMNISTWKRAGYREWLMESQVVDVVRRLGTDPVELNGVAISQLGDHLAVCLTAQIAVALRQNASGKDDPMQFKRLRQLCKEVVALRRGDHNAQWLELEREKLDAKKSRNPKRP